MTRLVFDALSVTAGGGEVLADVSLTLAPGEVIALVGPNGAGKTTLLRAAVGLVAPARGNVTLGGRAVGQLPPRERAARIAWLPQVLPEPEAIPAVEIVAAARFRFDEPLGQSLTAAHDALARVGAATLAPRSLRELSGGERQRVAIAALLAQRADLVLLDEPANHLDPAQQLGIYRLIGELWRAGAGILCVTHDINLLTGLAIPARVRVVGLARGQARFELPLADPGLPAALGELFGTPMRALETGGDRVIVAHGAGG